ncbi:MAG: bifunctional riboflavin kinase/FAD synthetase [Gammaproteobacteria bacterium]|nr:bifunctional riboflavin kinase/FAD synthetase [Gammaproteobacteria bacterium]
MELIRGLVNLRPSHRGCVATIGNFDGVHLGHQAVIGQLALQSDALSVPSTVVTFEPQPREYFSPNDTPARLSRLREKLQALRRYAVDRVLLLRFDQRLATQPADAFVEQVLVQGLGLRYLVVGDDFRFGRGREGSFASLRAAGERHGFPVVNMSSFQVDGVRVSSTAVREALAAGDMQGAELLLGRPYRICGRVAHGDRRGREIGWPTANLHLHRRRSPVAGVFAVEVFGIEGEPLRGVANVGTRPTVGGTRTLLEVHLFGFSRNIYGEHLNVDFLHRIRAEKRFDSLEALKTQIAADGAAAQEFFDQLDRHD